MKYPRTTEQRLLQLYGYTLQDLQKIFEDCNRDKNKYKLRLEELDRSIAARVMAQVLDERTFVH